MPALGTGSAGVPPERAAPDIVQALKDFFDETGVVVFSSRYP